MLAVAEAEALADWIALHHRNLTTIYVTHGHFDHFYGLSVLLSRFPGARAIATPKSVEVMHQQLQTGMLDQFVRRFWPGQLAAQMIAAEPYEDDTFTLEGHDAHYRARPHRHRPLFIGEDGSPQQLRGLTWDVTDRWRSPGIG